MITLPRRALSGGLSRLASTGDEAAMVARLARDLPRALRNPIARASAVADLRKRLAARESTFLRSVYVLVYRQPRSPYRALLAHAGCSLLDLRAVVNHEGLDAALARLATAGVYITFDEWKGRAEVRRGSLTPP
ncbi:MAG: hypothetical protein U0821_03825 [Chloroflexota bacterium]